MNKLKFLKEDEKQVILLESNCVVESEDYHEIFKFQFCSKHSFKFINSDGREFFSSPIVKSEIREHVVEQFKTMIDAIKSQNKILLYVRMNVKTQEKFRIYYSYEVMYVPKNLTKEDRQVGKIVGSISGIKIVADESVSDDCVIPVIRYTSSFSKSKLIQIMRGD